MVLTGVAELLNEMSARWLLGRHSDSCLSSSLSVLLNSICPPPTARQEGETQKWNMHRYKRYGRETGYWSVERSSVRMFSVVAKLRHSLCIDRRDANE